MLSKTVTVHGSLIFSARESLLFFVFPQICPQPWYRFPHRQVMVQSTHRQSTGADREQLVPLVILLKEQHRGHQQWQGPLIGGGNRCQKCYSVRTMLAWAESHRRDASIVKSPSKATVITDEIDSEIEKFCFLWCDRYDDESVPHACTSA